MEKRKYYKLGVKASVFSDHTSRLKVTKNVPGSTTISGKKLTNEAVSNGHIIEIDKDEFDKMMSKVTPEEKKAAYEEQGLDVASDNSGEEAEEESGKTSGTQDEERQELLARLKKIQMTKSKRAEVVELPTSELKSFIEAEEKENK